GELIGRSIQADGQGAKRDHVRIAARGFVDDGMEVDKRVVARGILIVCGRAVGVVYAADDRVRAIATSQGIRRSVVTRDVVSHVLRILAPDFAVTAMIVIVLAQQAVELIADCEDATCAQSPGRRKHAPVPDDLTRKTGLIARVRAWKNVRKSADDWRVTQ